jgi:hypothetical protein
MCYSTFLSTRSSVMCTAMAHATALQVRMPCVTCTCPRPRVSVCLRSKTGLPPRSHRNPRTGAQACRPRSMDGGAVELGQRRGWPLRADGFVSPASDTGAGLGSNRQPWPMAHNTARAASSSPCSVRDEGFYL